MCYKPNELKSWLFGWFVSPSYDDHEHAYCFPSYESGTKTGLCMITLCRKDLDLYFKLKYNK